MKHHFETTHKLQVKDQERVPNYTRRIIKQHGAELLKKWMLRYPKSRKSNLMKKPIKHPDSRKHTLMKAKEITMYRTTHKQKATIKPNDLFTLPLSDTVHNPTDTQHHPRSAARHDPETEDTIKPCQPHTSRDDMIPSQQYKTIMTRPYHRAQVRSTQIHAEENVK